MSPGDEGCALGTRGLKEMVGILDISVARSARGFFKFLAEEAAARSERVASVRPEIAAEAALARVGRLWRYSVLCGWPGEVVGRLARLGMYMRSLKT